MVQKISWRKINCLSYITAEPRLKLTFSSVYPIALLVGEAMILVFMWSEGING